MDRDRILRIIKEQFKIKELPEEVNSSTIESWDSLGHLQLILSLEREFNIKFKTNKIPDLTDLILIEEEIKCLKQ